MNDITNAAVEDWEKRSTWSTEVLNAYLDKHEDTFVTFGLFPKGLRAITSNCTERIPHHKRIDGLLGIVSMNIEIIKAKRARIIV